MENDDNELLKGIKQYNFNFIKDYPDKLESEIKDMDSKALNLLTLDGAFLTIIITILFSSAEQLIDKIPRTLFPLLTFLVITYTLHFIVVAIFSIIVNYKTFFKNVFFHQLKKLPPLITLKYVLTKNFSNIFLES